MDLIQRNRQYELIIGDYKSGDGLLITDLQVQFDISKTTDNKKKTNSATIEVTNLSLDHIKLLDTDYPAAVFSAGYKDTGGVKRLFAGQVTHVSTRKSGTDRVTQIQMGTGYTELNHQTLSELVAPGQSVREVAEAIRKNLPGVSRGVYNGTNLNNEIIYGYPLMGTPKEMLDELAEKHALNWQVDDDTLYVNNNDRANTENFQQAYVISKYTGLIETPYRVSGDRRRSKKDKAKKPGIQMKILLNPDIRAGDIIYLEDTLITGWLKVDSLRHSGGWRSANWYTEIKASSLEKVEQKG
ncbi:MAG: hypothetical protein EOO06_00605 [Chitinophagaceae bacterium]|nr:MAG: hypothetical protein EOO06_00605 [Chitinophagaceae bacterium]